MSEHKSTIRKAKHVPQVKLDTVKELKKTLEEYPIVAILNLENLPAKQLQVMKGKLRKDAHILMAKKNLIKEAFKESKKPGIDKMVAHLNGMPALLLTKENPFRLFKIIKKSKSPAAIKPEIGRAHV